MNSRECKNYLDEDAPGFVVEYRGDFKEQMDKVDYACGYVINDTLAVVSVRVDDLERLRIDVPAIIFIEARSIYTLQEISPIDVDSISQVKVNPYLNLTGRGVVVGIIDSGVNYLNKEFIREDDTSRIIYLWDQALEGTKSSNPYIGTVYSNDQMNKAIQAQIKGENPYEIVPSTDDVGHGTEMAGIIGARGYNERIEGIANDCDFIVVKLLESPNYKKFLRENNLPSVPAYSNTEVLSAVEYLRVTANKLNRPLVIFFGVGSSEGSHDGYNITARYITSLSNRGGTVFVTGTGNQGNSEGHARNFIKNVGEIDTVELVVPQQLKAFSFYIWVQKPNRMALSIVSPTGEETGFLVSQIYSINTRNFYLIDTKVEIRGYDPEPLTGHQLYNLTFTDIKPGIWKFRLQAQYISNGRYDIWLNNKELLPPGMKFLQSVSENTLSIPATARNTISVAYYDGKTGGLLAESGKGFNTNGIIRPDIATVGTNILTISKDGKREVIASGSSVATAITAGSCALLIQWALVNANDLSVSSGRLRSLLIYAGDREIRGVYPNVDWGYGKLNVAEVFNILGGNYRTSLELESSYDEGYIKNLFIRVPKYMMMRKVVEMQDGE